MNANFLRSSVAAAVKSLPAAAIALVAFLPAGATAAINTFDSPGDVTLSNTPAAGTWYTDRYAPAGFVSGTTAPDGRLGTLKQSISANDADGLRGGFNGTFYNTQGRKFDLAPGATSAFIDLYVDNAWSTLTQAVTGAEGRLASFWATGVDGSNGISSYPIIEFNNDSAGFRIWNDSGWTNVGGFTGYDKWYQIGFTVNGSERDFYVNGAFVGSLTDTDTVALSNVILQGYNAGNSYNISWDNLTASAVPEPGSMIAWSLLGLTVGAGVRWRRRKTAV